MRLERIPELESCMSSLMHGEREGVSYDWIDDEIESTPTGVQGRPYRGTPFFFFFFFSASQAARSSDLRMFELSLRWGCTSLKESLRHPWEAI